MKNVFKCLLMCGLIVSATFMSASPLSRGIQEFVETLLKKSGRIVSSATKKSMYSAMSQGVSKYGDDVVKMVDHHGLPLLEQGTKYGDDVWRLCKKYPNSVGAIAANGDVLLPLAKRYGDDVMRLESYSTGLSARTLNSFGDDGLKFLQKAPAEDVAQLNIAARYANSPKVKGEILKCYQKTSNKKEFLRLITAKNIIAAGLSSAAVIAAYKVSSAVGTVIADYGWLISTIGTIGVLILLWGILRKFKFFRNLFKKENENTGMADAKQ